MRKIDYEKHIGERYGKLTIIKRLDSEKGQRFLCKCDCGKYTRSLYSDLTRKDHPTRSCGCIRKNGITCHNGKQFRIYRIYSAMKKRVFNPHHKQYKDYGGRGITICDEWLGDNGFVNFRNWSFSNGYDDTLTIDRIDNDGNYEPNNCRWITRKEQNNNRRNTKHVTYNGETKTLTEWANIFNIDSINLYNRIFAKGWDIERALLTPVKKTKGVG